MIVPPPLFKNRKEFTIVALIFIVIIFARLGFIYKDYKEILASPNYYTVAKILKVYKKNNNGSTLVKLSSIDGFECYLYNKKSVPKRYNWVLVKVTPKENLTFFEYLRGFFANGEIVKDIYKSFNPKAYIKEKIEKQHTNLQIKEFYNAIFLAEPLDRELRDKISQLGVSHLVALSGFHLGILWLVVFSIVYFPYKFLQKKFFPWRHRSIDIGIFALAVLAFYVLFVGYPPALIRAYVMLLIGWIALRFGFELISFKLLAIVLLIILALEPRLIVSLGLLFSIVGVFYIFLVLKWFKKFPVWFITLVAIPVGIFVLMFPVAHYFFPQLTLWQLSSPILSLLFIPFYPLSAIAHLVGQGDIFDKALIWLFKLPKDSLNLIIPNALFGVYVVLSIGSIFSKKVFFITLALAFAIISYSIYLLLLAT